MSTVTPAIRDFARRLIALEAARDEPPAAGPVRVCEGLRRPLAKLAGDAGFRSLLSRAVAVARAEDPALAAVRVGADGTVEGLDDPAADPDAGAVDDPGVAVVAHLVGLLVTFIGEPLTLQLVRDAWPDQTWTGVTAGRGDGS